MFQGTLLGQRLEEDHEFSRRIHSHENDQTVFIVREGCPATMREALHFLLGVCCAAPTVLWFEDKEVTW